MWEKVYRGDIDGQPSISKFSRAMIELLKGYPAFLYYGIFESYFNTIPGGVLIDGLEKDGLIQVIRQEGKSPLYKLTKEGVDVATAMVSLEYSEETRRFTIWIIALTLISLLFGLTQGILAILQFRAMG